MHFRPYKNNPSFLPWCFPCNPINNSFQCCPLSTLTNIRSTGGCSTLNKRTSPFDSSLSFANFNQPLDRNFSVMFSLDLKTHWYVIPESVSWRSIYDLGSMKISLMTAAGKCCNIKTLLAMSIHSMLCILTNCNSKQIKSLQELDFLSGCCS